MTESELSSSLQMLKKQNLMHRAVWFGVLTAALLVIVKLGAWIATGSLALFASLIDSCLDVAASLINMMSVRHALRPADEDHRFGHGKAESIAGLAQAAFIGGSAVFLFLGAIERFVSPTHVSHEGIGIVVMLISMALTISLVFYQRYVVQQTQSIAISADSAHYIGDAIINASVIVTLVCQWFFGWDRLDSVFAVFIAGYLAINAWKIGAAALDQLMDKEMSQDERDRIAELCFSHDAVVAFHDLRTRVSGPMCFIQLHLEVNGQLSLNKAHDIADYVERVIQESFVAAEVIVHLDPVGVEELSLNPMAKDRFVAPQRSSVQFNKADRGN